MAVKVFYFYCDVCGGDTAGYDFISRCPYCHAGREAFRLIGEAQTEDERARLDQAMESLRATRAPAGTLPSGRSRRRPRWLPR